jgi:Leucine-rich repeat (LRR) protein
MDLNEFKNLNKNSTNIDLSKKNLSDSSELFNQLINFTELNDLNLDGNKLKTIPKDLSSFNHLKILNISNNPFTNVCKILTK